MRYAINPTMQVAASSALIQRGCVNVIGLEEIKDEVGERWEKVKVSVFAKLETLLRQKLPSTDYYTQIDDTSFLVSSPAASPEEAQIFCLRLAHELRVGLLGDCPIDKLRIFRATGIEDDTIETSAIAGDHLVQLAKSARLEGAENPESPNQKMTLGSRQKVSPVFSHRYVPIWDAQREAITTYRCVSLPGHDMGENLGHDALAKLALSLAISRVTEATKTLARHLRSGDRFLMWIPIPYDILTSPVGRMEVASVCRNLAAELRPYLHFEISDLPHGVPQSRLSELVGSLNPFCRGVAAQLPARIANYGAYLGVGLRAIGLSLGSFRKNGAEMGGELIRLSEAAKKQRVMSFAFDVPTGESLVWARNLGINLLSGSAIGSALGAPAQVKRLPMRDILGNVEGHVAAA
jgi:hypothetical protein